MRRREWERGWKRDDETLSDMLLLVDVIAPPEVIAGWTDEQAREAEWWASSYHLAASDNAVRAYPMPSFLALMIGRSR